MKRRIYLSGGMTGVERAVYVRRFGEAERILRRHGYGCINPCRVWPCRFPWLYRLMNALLGKRLTYAVGFAVILLLCWLFSGCTTTKYVPVTEKHTEHHWHTDSVKERDSTHTERETIIKELDSAAMAQYGIQMENNQKAWLILQREMENRLRELEHKSAVRDTVHDSIPKPYPVEVVKTETTGWWAFWGLVVAIVAIGAIVIIKRLKK